MESRIMQVFYDNDCLPYKDVERAVHYPIVGNSFNGANNTTQIRFFVDRIGGTESVSWVVVAKLPNGKITYQVLNTVGYEPQLGENYLVFDLTNYYTQLKGDLYIALNGYQGGVQVEEDSDTGIYTINGTPTIQTTGAVKLAINYSPQFPLGSSLGISDIQQVLGALADKLNIVNGIVVFENISTADLSSYETDQIFYDKNTMSYYKKIIVPPYYGYAHGILGNKYVVFRDSEGLSGNDGSTQFLSVYNRENNRLFTFAYNGTEYICLINTSYTATAFDILTGLYYQKTFSGQYSSEQFTTLFDPTNVVDSAYVSKTNTANVVYGTNNLGEQTTIKYNTTYIGSGNTIVMRDSNAQIIVPTTPIYNNDAASKKYVDDKVADFAQNEFQVVNTTTYPTLNDFLATTGQEGYIYLYPIDTNDLTKGYYRYIWENNAWLGLGTTQMDLTNYYTKTESDNKYVAKTSSGEKVYGTDEQGNQITYSVDSDLVGDGEIVRRESGTGTVVVGTPTSNTHATTKSYVDTGLSDKVDLTSNQTISGAKTFSNGIATDSFKRTNDNETYIERSGYSTIFYGNVIPKYNNSADLGTDTLKWKDLYLAGNLSDGTNTLSSTELIERFAEIKSMIYDNIVPNTQDYEYDYLTLYSIPSVISSEPTIFGAGTDLKNVKGNSFVVNQLVQNGNFASSSGWTSSKGTISVSSNELSLELTSLDSGNGQLESPTFNYIANHKLLVYCEIYSTTTDAKIFSLGGYPYDAISGVATTWQKCAMFLSKSNNEPSISIRFGIIPSSTQIGDTIKYRNAQVFDLTQCGLDSVSTTDQAISELAKRGIDVYTYNSYNTGTIVDSKPNKLSTIGFNQWDEQWESGSININTGANESGSNQIRSKNYIPVISGQSYFFLIENYSSYIDVIFYDKDKNYVGKVENGIYPVLNGYHNPSTIPSGVSYIRFRTSGSYGDTYNNDICINISNASMNGKYVPYRKYEYLPSSNYGIVDLGSLTWVWNGNNIMYSTETIDDAKADTNNATVPFPVDYAKISGGKAFWVVGSQFTDATAFKNAMSGVYALYELETPLNQPNNNPYITSKSFNVPILRSAGSVQDDASKVRVGTKTITSNDVYEVGTAYTNVKYFYIEKPTDYSGYGNSTVKTPDSLTCSKFSTIDVSNYGFDNVANIGCINSQAGGSNLWIGFAVGTTLDQAKASINGMVINYELATPTDQVATTLPENVNIQKGGTIQVEYASGYETPSDFTFEFATSKIGE